MILYYNITDLGRPPDMPKCGFDGNLCDYTLIYVLIGVLVFLAGKWDRMLKKFEFWRKFKQGF